MAMEFSLKDSNMEKDKVLVRLDNVCTYFPIRHGFFQRKTGEVKAVDGISFDINKGETLGLVGESGCGKSTIGRTILQLHRATSGKAYLAGIDLGQLKGDSLRRIRQRMQMIFQDPYASLNPRMTVGEIVAAPLRAHMLGNNKSQQQRVKELLKMVGMDTRFTNRYPHEFSGGQRQRIGIARALALNPEFIICDEPIAALDVSIQAQVVNLLQELQERLGLTYLFIAHDLSIVRHISNRIAVMYLGRIVELTDKEKLYSAPQHPYTQALLSAIPIPDPRLERQRERILLEGNLPDPANPPQGCNFNTRCPFVFKKCLEAKPGYKQVAAGHWVACHLLDK